MPLEGYPPTAFYFQVIFSGSDTSSDNSFQEVSGISSEIDVEEVIEGGENRFVHRLPKSVKHPKLILKRGIAGNKSPLVIWCKSVLEADYVKSIETKQIRVYLLNENKEPIRAWSFENAFPVKWEIDNFNSTKNDVAIETIELCYNASNRVI